MRITLQQIDETLALLAQQFPRAFFPRDLDRRPLKLGIHDDILERLGDQIEPRRLRQALRHYTHSLCYRAAQLEGVARINLDGDPAGSVSEQDALSAAKDVVLRRAACKAPRQSRAEIKQPAPQPPAPPAVPKRLSLADLREAAQRRKDAIAGDQSPAGADDQSERPTASESLRRSEPQSNPAENYS